jgi:cysteinyl-tRNA synthetase
LSRVLGLELNVIKKEEIHSEQIEKLLQQREQARRDKDWARADQIRDELVKLGVEVQDKKAKK